MYDYRRMSPEERKQILLNRRERGFPLHAPPHLHQVEGNYLITATCYEHRSIFDCPDDLSFLAEGTLNAFTAQGLRIPAWVFLPNHYHLLLETRDLSIISEILRLWHSRSATLINSRQHERGRKVWYRFSDRLIRNERHYWATFNYIHYNPVKHGYIERAEEWIWSSLHEHLETYGRKWLTDTWRNYPVKDYGKEWDW